MNVTTSVSALAFALFAAALANSAAAQTSSNGLVIIKLSGDRGWKAECTFERPDDSPITKRGRGDGGVTTFAVRGASGGECAYTGPRRGVMQVRFTDENNEENCPFSWVADQCIGQFEAGVEGSFKF